MTSQHCAVPGSPEGLGFTRSFLAVAAVLFFFFGPFVAELDDALPPPAIFSASSFSTDLIGSNLGTLALGMSSQDECHPHGSHPE